MQFDSFADKYEQVLDASVAVSGEDSTYFAEYKARYLAGVLPRHFSGKVLDFGCGVGLVSNYLRKHLPAARIHGFDVSPESISRVDAALRAQGTFTSSLPELASDYDLIVVANVMHHVEPADRQRTIRTLAERLAGGGRLAIFEHNPANPLTRWVVERCPFDVGVQLLRPTETAAHVVRAGLDVERRDYIVFMPRLLSWFRRLEPLLARVPIGAQYAILARKPETT